MVLSVLLLLILLIMGLAFLGSSAERVRSSMQLSQGAQALWLARAGLEDARTKLLRDLRFPPPGADDQTRFSYSEDLLDPDGQLVGSFTVTIDRRHEVAPYQVLRLISVGRAGPRNAPQAERVLTVEVDMAQNDRVNPASLNANLFRLLDHQDSGGL